MKIYHVSIFLLLFSLFSCDKVDDSQKVESKITAVMNMAKTTRGTVEAEPASEIVFTGNDIAWFNQKTREVKFNSIKPELYIIPAYAQIDVKIADESIFTIVAHINSSVNRAYDDLVLFYDLKDSKYYLFDSYPSYWSPESTQKNIQKRAWGWNKFLNQLKVENKLK